MGIGFNPYIVLVENIYPKSKIFFFVFVLFFLGNCQKNFNYHGVVIYGQGLAQGALQSSEGNCQNFLISGNYIKDSSLNSQNSILVSVNITQTGYAQIYTDTVNGCWFSFKGTIGTLGSNKVILRGFGIPKSSNFGDFLIHFNNSTCGFNIPNQIALFSFNAPPDSCAKIQVKGNYFVGARLNSGDSILVPIKISRPGTFTIQSNTAGGMVFYKSGVFTHTGNYTISIPGTGIPKINGNYVLSIQIGNQTCPFTIPIKLDPSLYWKFSVNGIQYSGLLDSAYGALPDTGSTLINTSTRVFLVQFHGGNSMNSEDSNSFLIVLSRFSQPVSPGDYRSLLYLGAGDWNGVFSYQKNFSPYNGFKAYTSSTYNNSINFIVHVNQIDYSTGLLEGTFSGPVFLIMDANDFSMRIVNISNGYFRTYLAH